MGIASIKKPPWDGAWPRGPLACRRDHAMAEVGIDVSTFAPRLLSSELVEDAAFLITMGCGDDCPVTPPETRRLDWALEDPKDKPVERVREIRDDIRERVIALLASEGCG